MYGVYQRIAPDSGHIRPTYMRRYTKLGPLFLYFWDRGPGVPGWWVGPEVGGDSACAFCPNSSWLPPLAGWYVVDPDAPPEFVAPGRAAISGRDVLLPSAGFREVADPSP